jgi:hypothetical protein
MTKEKQKNALKANVNMPKRTKKSSCPQCTNAITMGFVFKVCKDSLSDKINCKELSNKLLCGELTAENVIEKVKAAAEGNKEAINDLEEIEGIRETEKS